MTSSSEFLDHILSSTPDLIYVFDITTNKNVYVNQEIGDFIGYTTEEVLAMGDQLLPTLCHPEDFQLYRNKHLPELLTLTDGQLSEFTYRMKNKQGGYHWFYSREKIIKRNEQGEPQWLLGLTRKVDQILEVGQRLSNLSYYDDCNEEGNPVLIKAKELELHLAICDLNDSQQELQSFLDDAHDLIQSVDQDGNYTYVNPAWCQILGYSTEEIKDLNVLDVIDPKDHECYEELLYQLSQTQNPVSIDIVFRSKLGNPIFVEGHLNSRLLTTGPIVRGIFRDITGRKEAEAELRRTKNLLEQSETMAKVGGWELDSATDNIVLTPGARNILGLTSHDDFAKEGRQFYKPGPSQEVIEEGIQHLLTNSKPYDEVVRVVTKQKKELWVRAIGKPKLDDGKCVGLYGSFQDVDQQVKAQEELNVFKRFFKQSGDLMAVLDKDGIVQDINPSFANALDVRNQKLTGNHFASFIHPDYRSDIESQLRLSEDNERFTRFEASLNSDRVVDWHITSDTYQEIYFVIGRDVTQERQAKREKQEVDLQLEEKERYLRLLTQNMTDMVCLHKPNGDYLYVSPSSHHMTGYTPEELMHYGPYDHIHPSDIHTVQLFPEQSFADNTDQMVLEETEFRFRKKDGTYVWLHVTSAMVVVGGEVMAFTTSSRDITAKKIAERSSERYQKQLQRSNDELKNFAYIASHDLQEPLRMISSYLQLLEQRYTDKLDQDAQDFIGFAVDGAERMKRLINSLLSYSRVERQFQQTSTVDLNQVIEVVKNNLSLSIREHNVNIRYNTLPTIQGNDNLIIQLFQNLISNSIKFRSSNSVNIEINVHERKNLWQFSIKDDGIGIEEKFQKKIFAIFKKLNSHIEGTGIGLAVVKKVVDLYQGEIWVESVPNYGTTIHFTLARVLENENNESDCQEKISITSGG